MGRDATPSFSARHDARLGDDAAQTLYELEGFRSQLAELFELLPGDISVVM
jgi:hypothetical protein